MSSLDKIIEAGNLFAELARPLPLCLAWCIHRSAAGLVSMVAPHPGWAWGQLVRWCRVLRPETLSRHTSTL